MKRIITIAALLALLVPFAAAAKTYRITDDIQLAFELPSQRWTVSQEPAEDLVSNVVEHLHHDLEEKGREVPDEKVRQAARERLAANELFIRSTGGAHMEIDVSAIDPGDDAPSARGVRSSAVFAGQSLESEEGISEASSNVSDFNMPGASVTYRLDSEYVRHGNRMNFVGIIGFEDPYWLYFYATDPLLDERDASELDRIIESMRVVRNGDE